MQKTIEQVAWFVIVGCTAAATHWTSAVLAVSAAGMQPLTANIFGWFIAVGVSFVGHYRLTFRHQQAPVMRAARRFFAVSAFGFGVNELLYAWLLQITTLRYDFLLALLLIAMAVLTFILGRFWAFRHKH
jgi:putative flippase GtrA